MLLVSVFWVLLVFAPDEGMDDGFGGGAQLESEPTYSSVPMSGKPIKLPPERV
jgi:hypothetical protein